MKNWLFIVFPYCTLCLQCDEVPHDSTKVPQDPPNNKGDRAIHLHLWAPEQSSCIMIDFGMVSFQIAAASRIPGVTPAALVYLLRYVKKHIV